MQQLAVFSTSDASGIDELTLSGLIRAADVTSIGGVRLDDDAFTCLTDGVAGGLAYEVAIHPDADQNSENSTARSLMKRNSGLLSETLALKNG